MTAPAAAADPKTLQIVTNPEETMAQSLGRASIKPAVNAAVAMQPYQGFLGEDVNLMATIEAIRSSTDRIKGGDLSDLEAMLTGQAVALQTIFTSLARRAQAQTYQRNLEAFLGLALKAQAQSRATISALVDLKYPRQVAFVKQANISNGPQQVNNGATAAVFDQSAQARAHGRESQLPEIKELEVSDGQWLDTGTKGTTGRTDPHLEAVGKGDRANKPRRKSQGLA
ncbi:hypothetical protein WKW79_14615 [Variovorax robiniae]|uniref:Uncharacterized protein n=1 Tax=Variovorax robiniae TaxID=1836199 RepID=A0ABU8X7P4_9BURK